MREERPRFRQTAAACRIPEGGEETSLRTARADADALPAVSPPTGGASQIALAVRDIVQGARTFHLWGLLGWHDIRRRYRRSKLGPFWLTITMGILVGALGTLYGTLFKLEAAQYVPFLALGFVVWGLLHGLITEGCAAFVGAESIIKQACFPRSIHVYRVIWRNLVIFAHNAVIFAVVAVVFSVRPGWAGFLALPGLVLLCLNGLWAGLFLGIVSARFRDVPPIVESVMRIAFFVTPIIWMPSLVPDRAMMLEINPFYHFVTLVRAPMLGEVPALDSWLVVLGITAGGWLATFALFCGYRRRIAYWV